MTFLIRDFPRFTTVIIKAFVRPSESNKEYESLLIRKSAEEAAEFDEACREKDFEKALEEVGDYLEVAICRLIRIKPMSIPDIEMSILDRMRSKRATFGSFIKGKVLDLRRRNVKPE